MYQPETKLLAGTILLVGILASCTNKQGDCVARADCPLLTTSSAEGGSDGGTETGVDATSRARGDSSPDSGGATNSGSASASGYGAQPSGTGGTPSAAGAAQKAESVQSLGAAGTSFTSEALPCDGRCSGKTPICDSSSNRCVECTSTTPNACTESGKLCGRQKTCVECESSLHCSTVPGKPVCDDSPSSPRANTCVQCRTNDDCTTPEASVCDTSVDPLTNLPRNVCVGCTSTRDCVHIAGKQVCLSATATEPSRCVECTKDDAHACSNGAASTLCHGLEHVCTNRLKSSAGLCQPCISDAECVAGQACVPETFGLEQTKLYACLWKKGDPTPNAPISCSDATNQPYIITRPDVTTIDGAAATVCGLAVSTCAAVLEAVTPTINCAPDGVPNHSLCSFEGYDSARCVSARNGAYQCSPRCSKNADCFDGISSCMTTKGEMACAQ